MTIRLSEVGLAVRDLDAASQFFASAFGIESHASHESARFGLRSASIRLGEVSLNLITSTDGSGSVGRFLEKRGEGLFNVIVDVPDLDPVVARFRAVGSRIEPEFASVSKVRQANAATAGRRVTWSSPSSTHGLLLEMREVVDRTSPSLANHDGPRRSGAPS